MAVNFRSRSFRTLVLAVWVCSSNALLAQQNLSGSFNAHTRCNATVSLNHNNPGAVVTEAGKRYQLLASNKNDATHYLLLFPNAPVATRRWVSAKCGAVALVEKVIAADVVVEPDSIENVLAASWQPAFCQTNRGKTKQECLTQTRDRADATQFSIHGLWPDDLHDKEIFPCYCDSGKPVSCRKKRKNVSSMGLDPSVQKRLEILMPGTQSGLHLHEWSKHGTCYEDHVSGAGQGATPDEYFSDTMQILDQLNSSAVRDLFVAKIGLTVTFVEVQDAFDQSFGEGAGQRVMMRCSRIDGHNAVTELWIGMAGEITEESLLSDLMLAAPTTDKSTNGKSCKQGVVIPSVQ